MKPILFNTPMAQAVRDGIKTETRRVVKASVLSKTRCPDSVSAKNGTATFEWNGPKTFGGFDIKAPYQPGDILYVRETWTKLYYVDPDGYTHYDQEMYYYAADGAPDIRLVNGDGFELDDQRIKWHPSIHMPKEAARLFLRVTGVRVERLQDINTSGCIKEGITEQEIEERDFFHRHAAAHWFFERLWNSTIKKPVDLANYGWSANPWVWVIQFEKISREEAMKYE